jgi:hypothetical protein
VPFLIACVGLDSDTSTEFVTPKMLRAWTVDQAQVFSIANETLTEHAAAEEDVEVFDASAPYPMFHVSRDDSYEASRLVLPGWLASFRGRVRGNPVAIVPERSFVVIGGDDDDACLARLIDTADRQYESSPRKISPALYTLDASDRVVPLVLDRGHPLADRVRLGHLVLAASEYGIQKEVLDEAASGDADDADDDTSDFAFPASFKVFQLKDSSDVSRASWSEGVTTLLPETDEVSLVERPTDPEPRVTVVPWAQLVASLSDCLAQEPNLEPRRWRTIAWPDAEAIERLRNR